MTDQTGAQVNADTATFPLGDRLQLTVDSSKAATSTYEFELRPTQGKITGIITERIPLDQTGSFSLAALVTSRDGQTMTCPVLPVLNVVASRSCDKVRATFLLGNSSARGATSSLFATVTLPAGLNVTVIATPQGSIYK